MEANKLPQPYRLIAVAVCFAMGRWIVVALFLTAVITALSGSYGFVRKFALIVIWPLWICFIMGFALSRRLKCPACGKNVVDIWSTGDPGYRRYEDLSFFQKVSEFFVPRELRKMEANCANCGVYFNLRKEI